MKINRINIISFGGLKNYSLDFTDGFNCIYGENENGKTTILSFIKMMFYGNERGSSQISKNIRKKYTPWDGSPMAGSIEFEIDGRNYRIEREFRSSNSTDKISLTDLALGEKEVVSGDIGNKLFGLSAAAFERSIFIGQLGFPESDSSAESEINSRLSNMVSTGDESVSMDLVKTRIEKARFSLISKSGKAGEYYKNYQYATELKSKLESSRNATERYMLGKEKLAAHKAKTNELIKKAEDLKNKISKEQDIRNANKLKELLKTKAELEGLKAEFKLSDGSNADENYLRRLKFCISKVEAATAKVSSKESEAEIIKNQLNAILNAPKLNNDETPETINEALILLDSQLATVKSKIAETEKRLLSAKTRQEDSKTLKKSFNPLLLLFGILLLILCPILMFANLFVVGIVSATIGLVLAVLSFIIKPVDSNKLKLLSEEISALESTITSQNTLETEIKEQILSKKARLDAINLSLNSNSSIIEAQNAQLKLCEAEITALKEQENSAKSELNAELEKLGITDNSNMNVILDNLGSNAEKQKELKQQINFLLNDLNGISYEAAEQKLREMENATLDLSADFAAIKTEYDGLISKITERRATEGAVEAELKSMLVGNENPDVLELNLGEIIKLMEEQKAFCDSADIALEVLAESFAELRQNYGSELEKKSAEIFSKLTSGKYNGMTISKSFGINVEETKNPISRESDYLSSGTVDQAYLSLRLAIAKLISTETVLPLFLDDSLTQYDDSRAKATLEFLKSYATVGQIIMFTCHKAISDYTQALGGTVKNL